MSGTRAVARLVHQHRRRDPGGLRSLLGPVLAVGALVAFFAFTESASDGSVREDRTVAVVDPAAVGFPTPGLDLRSADDPETAVADGDADLGVEVAGGGYVAFFDPDDDASTSARDRFRAAVAAADRPALTAITVTAVEPGAAVALLRAGRLLLLALAYGALNLIGSSVSSVSSATAGRVLEPLAVLPGRRRHLALGLGLGHLPVLLVQQVVVGVLGAVVVATPATNGGVGDVPLGSMALGIALAVLGLVPLSLATVALSTAATARARRSVVGAPVALVLIAGAFVVGGRLPDTPAAVRWLPGLSSLRVAADGLLGTLDPSMVAASVASSLVAAALLVGAASRVLSGEASMKR